MAVAVSTVIGKTRHLLNDEDADNYRWQDVELLAGLNSGQKEAAIHKTDIYTLTAAVQLAVGTKQAAPAGSTQIIDIYRNMGVAGSTPGNAIRIVPRHIMDTMTPDWHASTAAAVVRHAVFDERNPKVFWVYPPNTGTYIEMCYALVPPDTTLVGNISLDDIWETALVDYVTYRAMMKDSDDGVNQQTALAYYRNFLLSLGAKDAAEALYDPNRRRRGE